MPEIPSGQCASGLCHQNGLAEAYILIQNESFAKGMPCGLNGEQAFSHHRSNTDLKEVLHKHFKRVEMNDTFPNKAKIEWMYTGQRAERILDLGSVSMNVNRNG